MLSLAPQDGWGAQAAGRKWRDSRRVASDRILSAATVIGQEGPIAGPESRFTGGGVEEEEAGAGVETLAEEGRREVPCGGGADDGLEGCRDQDGEEEGFEAVVEEGEGPEVGDSVEGRARDAGAVEGFDGCVGGPGGAVAQVEEVAFERERELHSGKISWVRSSGGLSFWTIQ